MLLWRKESYYISSGLTREEVLAQGMLFFLAGFETTSNALSLLGYSLATNPECQETLLREIDVVMKDHVSQNGKYIYTYLSCSLALCKTAR